MGLKGRDGRKIDVSVRGSLRKEWLLDITRLCIIFLQIYLCFMDSWPSRAVKGEGGLGVLGVSYGF